MSSILDALPQWLAAVGGVTGLVALFQIRVKRRQGNANAERTEANANKIVTDSAVGLLHPLNAQIAFLALELKASREENALTRRESQTSRAESEALRDEVQQLREYVSHLIDALEAANVIVPPRPALATTDGSSTRHHIHERTTSHEG